MSAAFAIRRSWVAGVLLALLAATLGAQQADTPVPRVVRVTAERFAFTPSEVKVAPGTSIEFRLKSEDTSHGFRIIGQSVDIAIPKRGRGELVVPFEATEPGDYVFECSRMCGAGHSFMRGVIRVRADGGKESR